MIILDVRSKREHFNLHIDGAISFPFYELKDNKKKLDIFGPAKKMNRWILTYCACPHALSSQVARTLIKNGFDKVAVIDEGLDYWYDKGYPTVRKGIR